VIKSRHKRLESCQDWRVTIQAYLVMRPKSVATHSLTILNPFVTTLGTPVACPLEPTVARSGLLPSYFVEFIKPSRDLRRWLLCSFASGGYSFPGTDVANTDRYFGDIASIYLFDQEPHSTVCTQSCDTVNTRVRFLLSKEHGRLYGW
jgi:hypothetical protein